MSSGSFDLVAAGDIGVFRGGSGFPVRFQGRKSGELPFFKVSDMNTTGNELFMVRANNYVSEKLRASMGATRMPAGSIVFAKVGAAVFLERKRILAHDSCIDNNMAAFIVDNSRFDLRFLHYLLSAFRLSSLVATTALPSLNGRQLRSIPLLMPSSLSEQREIAATLSSVDELISSLERLIEKKNSIKQSVLQQLLSGRTRLPGFSDSWTVRKVGDFADVKSGGTPSTGVPRYWGGSVRWMSSGEIHRKRVTEVDGRITFDGLRESSAQILPVGSVLVALAGQGKTRGTVAISRVELSTNQSIAGIVPRGEHDPDFLYYNLDTRYLELRGESTGDGGRGGLNLTIIKKLEILMPNVAEQQAIASVLIAIDNEIDALERRSALMRRIKQGMMQELLTGRTRLMGEEAAA